MKSSLSPRSTAVTSAPARLASCRAKLPIDPAAPAYQQFLVTGADSGFEDMARAGAAFGPEVRRIALFVDTSMNFPFAFADPGWKKAGVALASLQPVPGAPQLKAGVIPYMQIGAFELPKVEAVHLEDAPKDLEIEIDGTIGAPLLAAFRVTLFDGGRSMWLEDTTQLRDGSHPAPPDEAPDTELPAPGDVPVVPQAPGMKAPQLAPPDVAAPADDDEKPSKPPGAAKPPAKKK